MNKPLRNFNLVHALGDMAIGREARSVVDDHAAVRLWLRLQSCSMQIEREIRALLRQNFDTTLPLSTRWKRTPRSSGTRTAPGSRGTRRWGR